jgi:hypothetical protein
MVQFNIASEFKYEESIASLDIADLTGDGIEDIIITTMDGSLRILNYTEDAGFQEIARLPDIPPIAALSHGKVLGQESYDFVLGLVDNSMRIVTYLDNELEVGCNTPLGSIPTSICVLNVVGDESAEVIVSTNDKALRCYGWFDVALDKLAHKVIDHPTYMMSALGSKGIPYSRFVFGDDTGIVYIYQYADDRLHEISRAKAKGNVRLVTTGDITENRTDDIVTVSDGRNIGLYRYEHPEFKKVDSLKASSPITCVRVGKFLPDSENMQILATHDSSTLALLRHEGNRLHPVVSTRTTKKSIESFVAYGDLVGDSGLEIVQAVQNKLYLITIE